MVALSRIETANSFLRWMLRVFSWAAGCAGLFFIVLYFVWGGLGLLVTAAAYFLVGLCFANTRAIMELKAQLPAKTNGLTTLSDTPGIFAASTRALARILKRRRE